MCCHQYPTGACVTGNGEVRSLWDNVSSSLVDGSSIVRSGCDGSHQGGRELGWCGKVNERESPINAVTHDQPKMLRGWGQQARGQDQALLTRLAQMVPHRRRGETSPARVLTRNVVNL